MTMETNSTDTGTSTAATPATDVGKKAAVRKPRPSELAMKAAKAAKAVKAGAASNGKGTSKSAAKTTPKGTSGTPKAGKTTTSGTTKVSKPAKTMKTTPKKGSTATDSKSKLPAAGKKTAAEKGSEGRSSGPRPGSGMAFVLKLVKAGKTDEEILATAAKELPKVKSVNDPRGVTWYRWQLKKNGWI